MQYLSPGLIAVLVLWGAYALVIGVRLAPRYRWRIRSAVRDALLWVLIFGALVGFYTFRGDFRRAGGRIMAELDPGLVSSSGPQQASVVQRSDGEFVINALANGRKIRFMFDTGATTVTLRAQDAARLGLPVDELIYNTPVSTANGRSMAAQSALDTLAVGAIVEKHVAVLVARPGALDENLLGRNFLDGLASYSVENSRLILRAR